MTRPHFPAVDPDTKLPSAAVQAAWQANFIDPAVASSFATVATTKVDKGALTINVVDYGAVGDTQYLDQRVSSGTFGLSGATPQDAAKFGKGFKDSGFTQAATDNTSAFRAAFDAMLTAGKFAFTQRAVLTGNRSLRRELYIPAGAYYISDAAGLFSLLRQSPSGTQAGIRIRGDGKLNTILFVRITGSGSDDYLFLDNNAFFQMELEGLTIVGTTGNERFIYQTSTGNAKRWTVSRCQFKDYKDFLTIAGSVNADRWPFVACDWVTSIAGARLFVNPANTQALAFEFIAPTITHHAGGDVFDIGAGGQIHIWGGSAEIYGLNSDGAAGRFVKITNSSTSSDQLVPSIVITGFKLEAHDDAGIADVTDGHVTFRDSNVLALSNTRIANGVKQHVVVRHYGELQWFGGCFGDFKIAMSTDPVNDYTSGNRAHVLIKDAWVKNVNLLHTETTFYTNATDGLTTSFDTTATGGGVAIGRVQVEGCRPWQVSHTTGSTPLVALNGTPNHEMTWGSRSAETIRVTHRGSTARGLGLMGSNVSPSIVIPPRCTLVRAGIVKQSENVSVGGASRTWSLKDGNGTTLATLTALGTDTWVTNISAELSRQVRTTNDRTFTLTCDTAATDNTGCEGYFFIEYI